MARHTRCQGLIIKDHKILLIQHSQNSTGRSFWVIPGGGLDGSETEEECVIREMKEETNLDVKTERWFLMNLRTRLGSISGENHSFVFQ